MKRNHESWENSARRGIGIQCLGVVVHLPSSSGKLMNAQPAMDGIDEIAIAFTIDYYFRSANDSRQGRFSLNRHAIIARSIALTRNHQSAIPSRLIRH
jgi:hypothetical protein